MQNPSRYRILNRKKKSSAQNVLEAAVRANNLEHIVLERLKCGLSTSAILAELSGAVA